MTANLDHTTGSAAFAFIGSRNDIWHREGQQMRAGMTIQEWHDGARFFHVSKVPLQYMHGGVMRTADNLHGLVRDDTGAILGHGSDIYQTVQPLHVLQWFFDYIGHDERFAVDAAGAIGDGRKIWAAAIFKDPLVIGGDKHAARLLMTTSFDGTLATINQATMTRVVCQNTLNAALADKRCVVKTRHSTKFQPKQVASELASIAQGFESYKAMGDALADFHMGEAELVRLFKLTLDIPLDAQQKDISTRKFNQYRSMWQAYRTTTRRENAPENTGWSALQAVTRYVDHDRSVQSGDSTEESARFASAQWGTGAALKQRAVESLMASMEEKLRSSVPVRVPAGMMAAMESKLATV